MHLAGPDHLKEILIVGGREFHFKISPTSFFQPHTLQAEALYFTAISMLKDLDQAIVYDLYCGTATLGLILATQAKHVVGIELNPHAILDAKANQTLNQISNFEILQGDVGGILSGLKEKQSPDIIVMDPPRAGLDEKAIQQIIDLNAPQLLYISCNPMTQAHNSLRFVEAGYHLSELQPIDQFPHTPHIENIALFHRTSSQKKALISK